MDVGHHKGNKLISNILNFELRCSVQIVDLIIQRSMWLFLDSLRDSTVVAESMIWQRVHQLLVSKFFLIIVTKQCVPLMLNANDIASVYVDKKSYCFTKSNLK